MTLRRRPRSVLAGILLANIGDPGIPTQAALAAELGLERSTLNRLLVGRSPWTPATLLRAAGFLEVTFEQVAKWAEEVDFERIARA